MFVIFIYGGNDSISFGYINIVNGILIYYKNIYRRYDKHFWIYSKIAFSIERKVVLLT